MSMVNMGAEIHKAINENWLNDDRSDVASDPTYGYDSATGQYYVDCTRLWTGIGEEYRTIRPRGILIGSASGGGTVAYVDGWLWGENPSGRDRHMLVPGVVHPLCFKRIYIIGTTARNIKIYG